MNIDIKINLINKLCSHHLSQTVLQKTILSLKSITNFKIPTAINISKKQVIIADISFMSFQILLISPSFCLKNYFLKLTFFLNKRW